MLASGSPFLQMALRKYQQASRMPDFSSTPTVWQNNYFWLVLRVYPVLFQPTLQPSFLSLCLFPCPSYRLSSYRLFCCSSNNFIMKLDYMRLISFLSRKQLLDYLKHLLIEMEEILKTKKYKWCAFIFLLIIQLILFASVGISVYALLTLNLQLLSFLLVIVVLQIPLRKVQPYVDLIVKYNHPAAYFDSFEVRQDAEIPPSQKCIFAYHPHSIYGMGILGSNNFPGKVHFSNMVVLSSDFALNVPILGALLKIWGVGSASSSNVKKLMKEGKNIGVLPGGFEQATITSPNQMRCWINQRKGFIKYALQNDYKICPTIVLGEHKGFWTLQALQNFRLLFNKIKIPGVLFWNRYSGIFLPTNMYITVITGKLISKTVSIPGQPTKQEINEVHSQYVKQIERLYNKYRDENGNCALKFY